MQNLFTRLEENATRQPDKAAFVFADSSGHWQSVTFRQVFERSQSLARGLATYNISPGTRAVLMIAPSVEFFALVFALLKLGIVLVLIDPGIGLRNVTLCLAEAKPEIYLGSPLTHGLRMLFGWGKSSLHLNLSLSDIQRAAQKQPSNVQPPAIRPDAEMAVIFTSGSTGLPKGAVYTIANFAAQIAMLEDILHLHGDEVDLPAFPIFALIDCLLGITAVVPDMRFPRPARVDPRRIIAAIQTQRVDTIFASPVVLARLARYGREHSATLPSLQRIITAGAPAPVAVLEEFRQMLNDEAEVWGVYGSTETLPVALVNGRDILNETRYLSAQGAGVCIGRPVAGADVRIIRIDDGPFPAWDNALRLPDGQIGEIAVKGAAVTGEYAGKAAYNKLAKIRDADGQVIHRMGDLGYFDGQGRLWYCGRKSHRIQSGGEILFTEAVEGIFNDHPQVYRSALVGVARAGQTEPVLWVEIEPAARSVDKTRLRAELLELAANNPVSHSIRTILFHSNFPTDIRHNSKIIREKLARQAQRKLT